MASLSRSHCGCSDAAPVWASRLAFRPRISSSNEKCLAVNEINTDIRLAQQELGGKERVRGREEVGEIGSLVR